MACLGASSRFVSKRGRSIRPLLLGAGRLALGQQVMFFITFASNPLSLSFIPASYPVLGVKEKTLTLETDNLLGN